MNLYENLEKDVNELYSKLKKQQVYSNDEEFENQRNQIEQEYGLSKTEMDNLIDKIEQEYFLYEKSTQNYNNGDDYYNDTDDIDSAKKSLEESIKTEIEKYIKRHRIDEINLDEINPELIEQLQENGYDGESGHPVLQSYFRMYFNVKENESKSNTNSKRISELENELDKKSYMVEVLKERDEELSNFVNAQSQLLSSVKQKMDTIKQKTSEIKPYLKPKSFGEKVVRFFSRNKKKEIKKTQDNCNEMMEKNGEAIKECIKAEHNSFPKSIDSILKEMPNKVKYENNIYDKIVSPIEKNEDLADLINIYSCFKDKNTLNKMYNFMVSDSKELSPEIKTIYEEKFYSFIVQPAVSEMEQRIKQGVYERFDNSFEHLYSIDEMKQMFSKKNTDEILTDGKNIESRNKEVFDKLNSVFWNNGNVDRKQIYINFLEENNISLNEEELNSWMNYRAVIEEFQNPKLMGFRLR